MMRLCVPCNVRGSNACTIYEYFLACVSTSTITLHNPLQRYLSFMATVRLDNAHKGPMLCLAAWTCYTRIVYNYSNTAGKHCSVQLLSVMIILRVMILKMAIMIPMIMWLIIMLIMLRIMMGRSPKGAPKTI